MEIVSALAGLKGEDRIFYKVSAGQALFQLMPRFNTAAIVDAKVDADGVTEITVRDGSVAKWNGQWMPFAGILLAGSRIETLLAPLPAARSSTHGACEDDCRRMSRDRQLKEGVTAEDCIKQACR
jgi:hypothetical protein